MNLYCKVCGAGCNEKSRAEHLKKHKLDDYIHLIFNIQ